MTEFELQGDISSGFRWRIKGEPEARKEAFVPLGEDFVPLEDSSRSKEWARIQAKVRAMKTEREDPPYIPLKRRPSGEEIVFDPGYDLLLFSEREVRRQLLAPWAIPPPDCLKKLGPGKFVDPCVALVLHRQEVRDKEIRDLLDALLGKGVNWRSALCLEARRNDCARSELERVMGSAGSAAALGDTREVDRFHEALKAVDRLKTGPVKVAKAQALYFVLERRARGESLPTRGEVLDFLRSKRIPFVKEHAARDIFTGPILSTLLRSRAGRPRKTRRARGK